MGDPAAYPSDPSKVKTTPFAMPNMLSAVELSDWLNSAADGSFFQGAARDTHLFRIFEFWMNSGFLDFEVPQSTAACYRLRVLQIEVGECRIV